MSDFDFQAYINSQQDPEARARALSFTDYAFRGDIKWQRTLDGLAPVRVLISGTLSFWRGWGRDRVLTGASKASEREGRRAFDATKACAKTLSMAPVHLYLAPKLGEVHAVALGDQGEQFVVLHTLTAQSYSDEALRFVIGREFGAIQNGHILYQTAAFYGEELAGAVMRWSTGPARLAITRWRAQAIFTTDRAGLLCAKSLDSCIAVLARQAVARQQMEESLDLAAVLNLEDPEERRRRLFEVLAEDKSTRRRIEALELFSQSQLYLDAIGDRSKAGKGMVEVDDEVAAMLRG